MACVLIHFIFWKSASSCNYPVSELGLDFIIAHLARPLIAIRKGMACVTSFGRRQIHEANVGHFEEILEMNALHRIALVSILFIACHLLILRFCKLNMDILFWAQALPWSDCFLWGNCLLWRDSLLRSPSLL